MTFVLRAFPGMDPHEILEEVALQDEESEIILYDGFEDALIGVMTRKLMDHPVALYDRDKCIQILVERDGMTWEGALECFEFNTADAWVGPGTPAFATLGDTD